MSAWNICILIAIAVVGVLDLVLSLTKHKAYFSSGFPIFRQELLADSPDPRPPSAQSMESGVGTARFSRLTFHQLDGNTLGFHEAVGEGGPVLRGLLRFDLAGARVEVTGVLDWFLPLFLVIAAIKAFEFHVPLVLLGAAGFLTLICLHKVQRCRQVARYALQQWNA